MQFAGHLKPFNFSNSLMDSRPICKSSAFLRLIPALNQQNKYSCLRHHKSQVFFLRLVALTYLELSNSDPCDFILGRYEALVSRILITIVLCENWVEEVLSRFAVYVYHHTCENKKNEMTICPFQNQSNVQKPEDNFVHHVMAKDN